MWVAALIAFIGAVPLATARWYLGPVLLVPLTVGLWAWRTGTDADPTGVRVRALLSQRRIPWARISGFVTDANGRTVARLTDGRGTVLPAVRAADLPKLIAASGQPLVRTTDPDNSGPAAPPAPGD
nr:PH domain-containing protein [Micromonospora sp. DSM 115978]